MRCSKTIALQKLKKGVRLKEFTNSRVEGKTKKMAAKYSDEDERLEVREF